MPFYRILFFCTYFSAWRKTCNNCDTKKPRNAESLEREAAEEKEKKDQKANSKYSRERSREHSSTRNRDKDEYILDRPKAGHSRERRYYDSDDKMTFEKDRKERHRNDTDDIERSNYTPNKKEHGKNYWLLPFRYTEVVFFFC